MNNKKIQKTTSVVIIVTLILFNFTLATSDYMHDPELRKIIQRYQKIIQGWNVDSWNYGPAYKTADRKTLIDAIQKNVAEHRLSIEPEATEILTFIAQKHKGKPIYEVIQSINNYLPSILENIYTLEISQYMDEADHLIDEATRFWKIHIDHTLKLLSSGISHISENEYNTLRQACVLGDKLKTYSLLEIFDTQYNILHAVMANIETVNRQTPTDLSRLQNKTQEYMNILHNNLPKKQIHETGPTKAELATTAKTHQSFEPHTSSALRLYEPLTIDSYLVEQAKNAALKKFLPIIRENLQNYTTVQNVRGEGNCGYRAFLGSTLVNSVAFGDFIAIQKLQMLVIDHFIPLFKKYASISRSHYKLSVPTSYNKHTTLKLTDNEITAIQRSIFKFLQEAQKYDSIDQVEKLFNKNPEFDFFMIMFLRALIADELLKPERDTARMVAAAQRDEDENLYFANLLHWTTWIDQPELQILHDITGINVNITQQEAEQNALTSFINPSTQEHVRADILFVDGNHYKILHPKR